MRAEVFCCMVGLRGLCWGPVAEMLADCADLNTLPSDLVWRIFDFFNVPLASSEH